MSRDARDFRASLSGAMASAPRARYRRRSAAPAQRQITAQTFARERTALTGQNRGLTGASGIAPDIAPDIASRGRQRPVARLRQALDGAAPTASASSRTSSRKSSRTAVARPAGVQPIASGRCTGATAAGGCVDRSQRATASRSRLRCLHTQQNIRYGRNSDAPDGQARDICSGETSCETNDKVSGPVFRGSKSAMRGALDANRQLTLTPLAWVHPGTRANQTIERTGQRCSQRTRHRPNGVQENNPS